MQQLLPESAVYHIALAVRVLSPLDVSVLRPVLQAIFDRHDSLRTVFETNAGGGLAQRVKAFGSVSFDPIDSTGLSREEIDREVTAAFRSPFDLANGPLFRSHLFTSGPDDHLLLITAHHLVFDALSLVRVFTELLELYSSAHSGEANSLANSLIPIKAGYRDFVEWQAQMLAGPEGEAHLAFWREQLQGMPTILDFPADHPRPSHPSGRGGSLWFPIEDTLVERLKALAADLDIQLFDIFAAAWQILLYRYSGQTDILLGFVTGGRPDLRYARTIGSFSNTIVLRARFDGDPSCADFLRRQHERLAQGLNHQDYPFPVLVEKLRPARVPGFMPLTQVLFTYFMTRGSRISELFVTGHEPAVVQSDGFAMESYGLKQEDVEFDLALSVAEGKRCWSRVRFDSDLFDQPTVDRFAGHYVNSLRSIARDPSRTVSSIPLLGQAEREEILSKWNQTGARYPVATTVCELFEAQVAATPDRIAVTCGDRQLVYSELNSHAESVARDLLDAGVGWGDLVGVCMERSIDMLVALLAVWKVGAAYLPLDPDFPKARLDLIVEDAAPRAIVTGGPLVDGARRASRPSCVDLAYVLYTSGSAGQPKGVEIPHAALRNFLLSMRKRPGLHQDDVLLAVTTFSFDIAGLEMFLPLITGAKVVLTTREMALDGRQLAQQIESCGVTVMQATPATWRLLIDSGWTGCPHLKALCGGEAWSLDLAQALLPRVASLWNMYGPTETTIWSAVHQVGPDDDPIPLGSPIDNTALYILDRNLEPVPIGVPGELHIGGAGLARGYRNLPDLTASRFIEHPFVPILPSQRLYKTGDLCRSKADGSVLFLGRLDDQIKLRGHRIEPGEIESVLLRHPEVREAAVVMNEEQRLVAYLVGSATGMREYLAAHLPDYMIPSAFVCVDALPLTPNSKVDRKALRSVAVTAVTGEREYVAPRTPTEAAVAALWAEMLKAPRVGAHDRFDELGGDSLSFALMTIRAGNQMGIKIPVRIDGDMMSVAGFARAADRIKGELAPSLAPSFAAAAGPGPEPMAKTWYGQMLVAMCGVILRALMRIEVDGLENMPSQGPAILAGNHISLFDLVIFGSVIGGMKRSVPVTPTFIIADKWRWLAQPYASQFGNTIYIRRGQGDVESLAAAREVLALKGAVAITPEGRPTRGALSRARPGVAYLACETGVPVWPLAIYGHERIFEFWKALHRVPVTIRLGKGLVLNCGASEERDFQRHADTIMKAIAELMPREYHGVYSD